MFELSSQWKECSQRPFKTIPFALRCSDQWRIQDLSHGGGGGAWNSKTPKLVIAMRSRWGPALAPLGGSGGMLPREILKNLDAQICIFHYFGVQFQKNQRANLQGNLYINLQFLQNIWSHWEDQKKYVQHEENHASNGRPSNILLGCLCPYGRHHFFKIQVYVLVDTDRRSSAFKRPSDIVLRWSDLTNPRADFFFFFFFWPARGARVPAPPPPPPWIRYWWRLNFRCFSWMEGYVLTAANL